MPTTQKIQLIADSCCDVTPDMKEKLGLYIAPLRVRITEEQEHVDDGTVDIQSLVAEMKHATGNMTSSCPSVEEFAALMSQTQESFVVTLSSKLSGSFNAASAARKLVLDEHPEKKIHVFDSESASAGETLLILFLHDKLQEGLSFEEIVSLAEEYVAQMHTLFVLEDLGNLIKNGRMSKVSGLIASMLSLCPIMGDDGHGEIQLVAKVRGIQNSLRKMVDLVGTYVPEAASKSIRLTLSFCNCPERAESLKKALMKQCEAIREVVMVPTSAISSMYANDGGIVIAF